MSGGGDLSALLVDISGLELGNSLLSALGVPEPRPDRMLRRRLGTCGSGVLSTKTMILDTSDNIVSGRRRCEPAQRNLDYRLKTKAKHFSIGTLPAPIAITGPFKSPSIRPEILPIAARGGAAVALAFLFPPAALLPTIQFGVGDDAHCAPLTHGER